MKETLTFIVQSLVEQKDKVEITEQPDNLGMVYFIKVDPTDIGRVIGKKGRIINSLRTIFRAAGLKSKQNIKLEIVDDEHINQIESLPIE